MRHATRWRPSPAVGSAGRAVADGRLDVPPLADIDPADWGLIVAARHNMLLYGRRFTLEAIVAALRPHLRRPIYRWSACSGRPLPRRSTGTVVLENVGACSEAEQQSLLAWLNGVDPQVQVVSTTDQLLFDRVKRGLFRVDLYYHLNVVYLDLSSSA